MNKNSDVTILTVEQILNLSEVSVVHSLLEKLPVTEKIAFDGKNLGLLGLNEQKPIFIEIDSQYLRHKENFKIQSCYDELLARAIGLKRGQKGLKVLDATAGFLGDSLLLRAMGIEVWATERHPLLASMIYLAVQNSTSEFKNTFHFEASDAQHFLNGSKENFDAILYDPMYSHPNEKSKPKKDMQALRFLVDVDEDDQKVALELKKNTHRLVIKRPIKAQPLIEPVSHAFKGKSTRYDVYF